MKLFYLKEVFNPLWVVTVALPADSLHFFDLTSFTSSLNVFKVNVGLLTEIHNRPKEVKQAFNRSFKKETEQLVASLVAKKTHQKLVENSH